MPRPCSCFILHLYVFLFITFESGDAEKPQNAAGQCRRMYTVLPPPQGYNVHAEKSVTLFQLESVNREEDPTGKTAIVLTFMDIAMHHLVHRDL